MIKSVDFEINDKWVRSLRDPKHQVDAQTPYAYLLEEEINEQGQLEKVATIFLTNRECPFQCLMCDLWKNTLNHKVEPGDIPTQITKALSQLPKADSIKLYNSGNFFDVNAIPESDYGEIASLVKGFRRVIIENHPKLINQRTFKFQDLLKPQLEIAMGLETVHEEVLNRLNKKMTLHDFKTAVQKLQQHGIDTRAFILLKPPFLNEEQGVTWAKKSLDFAFAHGVKRCAIIPTRYGNGALDHLGKLGHFTPPNIRSLEKVMEYAVESYPWKVFADLWDLELFSKCSSCYAQRLNRLQQFNLHQQPSAPVRCSC
jgi:radical SAM enzyme (TIGR01210 family)